MPLAHRKKLVSLSKKRKIMPEQSEYACPICGRPCSLFDVVDFNKSCAEEKGTFLKLSGIPVYYVLCQGCGFCFAPEISAWSLEEFEKKIYNEEYKIVDPNYLMRRPHANHETLLSLFGKESAKIKHLDYGGGEGFLSRLLCDSGWESTSYDPFIDKNMKIQDLGTFDLITAFEVFEHVPDVNALMSDLRSLLAQKGIMFFSTALSDGNIVKNRRLDWWYASPRNGHVSLFSKLSLALLAKKNGLNFGSASNFFHFIWTTLPDWAPSFMHNTVKSPT